MGGSSFRIASGSTTPPTYQSYIFEESPPAGSSPVAYTLPGSFRGSISPQSYTGLTQWLDASNASSLVLDVSGNCSRILDLSGNGNHAFQDDITCRPAFLTSSAQTNGDGMINGLSTLHFKQTAQPNTPHLMFKRTGQRILPPKTYTLFYVWKPAGATNIAMFQGMWVNTAGSAWITGIGMTGNAANNIITWVDNFTLNVVSKDVSGIANNTPFIDTVIYDGSTISQYFTGSLVGSDSYSATSINHSTTTLSGSIGVYFGTNSSPSQAFGPSTGSLGEILLYDRNLTHIELTEIHRYLGMKWNISMNL